MDIDIFVWIFYGVLASVGLAIVAWELGHEAWLQLQCWWVRWTFKGLDLTQVTVAEETAPPAVDPPVVPEPPTPPKKTLTNMMFARAVGEIPTGPLPKRPWRRGSR